jgi:inhibitor of cysteine peptidase
MVVARKARGGCLGRKGRSLYVILVCDTRELNRRATGLPTTEASVARCPGGRDVIDPFRTRRVLAGVAVVLLVVSAVLAAGACGGSDDGGAAEIAYIDVTDADNEGTVQAEVYDIITVSLDENPSTGYVWEATLTPGFELLSNDYIADDTSDDAPVGSGGTHVWKLRVKEAGESRFMATLYPPDRKVGPDVERFTFKVIAE